MSGLYISTDLYDQSLYCYTLLTSINNIIFLDLNPKYKMFIQNSGWSEARC